MSDTVKISSVGWCIFLYAIDFIENVGHPVILKTTCFECSEAKKKTIDVLHYSCDHLRPCH